MGGVQPKRHTKGKRNRRRSQLALSKTLFSECQKCGKAVLPHHMCSYCGYYGGREVIDVMAKMDKKEKKKRQKEEAAAHEAHGKHPSSETTPKLNPEKLSKK